MAAPAMNPAYITALAALAGSVIGGLICREKLSAFTPANFFKR
jgi:hypothetical protein